MTRSDFLRWARGKFYCAKCKKDVKDIEVKVCDVLHTDVVRVFCHGKQERLNEAKKTRALLGETVSVFL